jgi:hypothetical protein
MTPRRSFPSGVFTVHNNCGRACLAVVAGKDGQFQGFEDQLFYDDEEDVYYWSGMSCGGNGCTGLYATVDGLARDVRRWPGFEGLD